MQAPAEDYRDSVNAHFQMRRGRLWVRKLLATRFSLRFAFSRLDTGEESFDKLFLIFVKKGKSGSGLTLWNIRGI